jgi:hypothetical protein
VVSALSAFGLPPFQHEKEALFAMTAAIQVAKELRSNGLNFSIGLATGLCYSGFVGDIRLRSQHSIYGEPVNLSARLCQQPAAFNSVLVDHASKITCSNKITFSEAIGVLLKGVEGVVQAYVPLVAHHKASKKLHSSNKNLNAADPYPMVHSQVGYQQERLRIQAILTSAIDDRAHRTLVIEGKSGQGKTFLAHYTISVAKDLGIST